MANTHFSFDLTGAYSGTECKLPLTIKGNESKTIFSDSHSQNTTYVRGFGLYRYGTLIAYGTEREEYHNWWPEFYLYPMKGYETIAQKEINSFWELVEKKRNEIRESKYSNEEND